MKDYLLKQIESYHSFNTMITILNEMVYRSFGDPKEIDAKLLLDRDLKIGKHELITLLSILKAESIIDTTMALSEIKTMKNPGEFTVEQISKLKIKILNPEQLRITHQSLKIGSGILKTTMRTMHDRCDSMYKVSKRTVQQLIWEAAEKEQHSETMRENKKLKLQILKLKRKSEMKTETLLKLTGEQTTALAAVLKQIENVTTVKIAKPVIKKDNVIKFKKTSIENLTFDTNPKFQARICKSLIKGGVTTINKLKKMSPQKLNELNGISEVSTSKIIKVITTL